MQWGQPQIFAPECPSRNQRTRKPLAWTMPYQDSSGCRQLSLRPYYRALAKPGHIAAKSRQLLSRLSKSRRPIQLLMDRAYDEPETQQLTLDLVCIPVGSPESNRMPWKSNRDM
jgi:hypothetical protein